MDSKAIIARDDAHVLHTYARSPLALVRGEGLYAYDAEGRRYLDFTSGIGVNALGYCHPAWVRAVAAQAGQLQHTSNLYYTAPCGALAEALCRHTGLDAVFFGNSGAEANEGAIKAARKYSADTYGPGRDRVLTLVNSFHGRTLATLTATGQDVFHHDFGPFPEKFAYVPAGDFAALQAAAAPDTCAVLLELVQGEGGVVALEKDYVARVAQLCQERDILLLVDEVQTGVGRTGAMWAVEHSGIVPDAMVLSKAIGGSLPLAVVVYREEYDGWRPGAHTGTFRGNTLAMAAGAATLRYVAAHGLAERAAVAGARMTARLRELATELPAIGDVRGRGLMIGVELVDPAAEPDACGARPADPALAVRVREACLARGLIVELGGRHDAVLRLLPPLTITDEQVAAVLERLADAVAAASRPGSASAVAPSASAPAAREGA